MTHDLEQLRTMLHDREAAVHVEMARCPDIDVLLPKLKARAKGSGGLAEPVDLQAAAVEQFATTLTLATLRDARLVCYGLSLRRRRENGCLLDDEQRFGALLAGLSRWMEEPRRYRRCYQGLLSSYFAYDANASDAAECGVRNWRRLQGYLKEAAASISAGVVDPDWVTCILENMDLFSEDPCGAFAVELLEGDESRVAGVREALGIDGSSWFVRALLLAQVDAASELDDDDFTAYLPRLLAKLADNPVVRDVGFGRLLDRYAECEATPLHAELRDRAVEWWGNPWLSSNAMRWGSVSDEARAMVTDWLKLEFIEAFFTHLVEEKSGDRRRLEFWQRYAKSIEYIQFALGEGARYSHSPDFVKLRVKMKGLTGELCDANPANNAFIMTMGRLVIVEFSGRANALYAYDRRETLPFSVGMPLYTAVGIRNSLKHEKNALWLPHKDNTNGYGRWEEQFEAVLFHQYQIAASSPAPSRRSPRTLETPRRTPPVARARARNTQAARETADSYAQAESQALASPYTRTLLTRFAMAAKLPIQDNTVRGGSLWLLASSWEPAHDRVLSRWGFKFKAGKGWWR